ncbi:MAG: alpha/beta fold hydrolase [Candidatus Saccharibacteria bacterium]
MKRQVLIIHGGTTFSNYEKYIDYLKNKIADIDKLQYRIDWKDSISEDLGNKYQVLVPRMPNSTNSRYEEWKTWFEKIIPLCKNGVILVGHSLGGIFLAKYLSKNNFPKKIKAVYLIAAPYEDLEFEELADFSLPNSLSKFNNQVDNIFLIQSKDDIVVPVDHVYMYNNELSNSNVVLFEGKAHFKQEHFPELVKLIKSL